MIFFEGKQVLYSVLCLVILPVISCAVCSFWKRRHIWNALWVNVMALAVVTAVFYPYFLSDIWRRTLDATTIYWLVCFVPAQMAVSFAITAIGYTIKKQRAENRS